MAPYLRRAVAAWFLILMLAFVNGGIREVLLIPALGRTAGLLISGAALSVLIVLLALACIRWIGASTPAQALRVGGLWLVLTLAFEFGFGAFVQHKPWSELVAAYTLQDGNIWPLVLVVTALAPLLATRLRRR